MRRALWLGAAVVALAGCGGGVPSIDLPTPPTTRAGAVPTTLPDTSDVALAGIPGVTTIPPPALAPGNSRITGTVRGPDGPVGGATVRIERFVGDASARADIVTRADGTFASDPILGGRYRVRAWRAPDLTSDRPIVFYLDDGKSQPVDLALTSHGGIDVGGSMSPNPPYEGALELLTVSVTGVSVDGNGIVRTAPVAGIAVDLTVPSGWQVYTADPQPTNDGGRATYQVRCTLAGSGGFSASVGGQTFTLELPSCATPPPTTTTTEPGATSTSVDLFTTTTRSDRGNGNGRPGSP
jgi:hypothetical protein